jgi:hypothetical protein
MPRRLSVILIPTLLAMVVAACGAVTRGGGGTPIPVCQQAEQLGMPVLVTPDDGSNVEIAGLTFHWVYNPAGCLPNSFEIQVSQTAGFSTHSGAYLAASETHWSPQVGMNAATIYYWRMRAAVADGPGPWSPTFSFYTGPVCSADSLYAPALVFPISHLFVYDAPSFQWLYPDGPSNDCIPEGYHLQVSTSQDFSSPVLDLRQSDPTTLWTPVWDLENCSTYFWRVAAIAGETDGPYSTPEFFSINGLGTCTDPCTTDQLVRPNLLDPPSSANVGSAPTEGVVPDLLRWQYPMPCLADGFVIHLATSPDFSDTSLFGTTGPATSFVESWGPSVPLEPATQYWWEVAAVVGNTQGPFSYVRPFFTGPQCGSPYDLTAPTLVSPADGETVDTTSPLLRFAVGEGGCVPDGYAIYLGTDPNFGNADPFGVLVEPDARYGLVSLEDCTTYYWAVAAILDSLGPRSETWSFTTQTGAACGISLLEGLALETTPCLHGPGPGWPTEGYFALGERAPIYARDMSGQWLAIQNPDNISEMCWVPREAVEPLGDDSGLRIFNAPAPACSADLAQEQCLAAGGTWAQRLAAGPPTHYCQCP